MMPSPWNTQSNPVALADGRRKGDPFWGPDELVARAAVESLRRSWPSAKGLANSFKDPREWARCSQGEKILRMAGLQHAVTHADADARTVAVFATLEADAAAQASQLRAAALSRLRSYAGALTSAWLTARPSLVELMAVEFRTAPPQRRSIPWPGSRYSVRVRPRCGSRRYPRPCMRCSVAHNCGSSQHYGGCMAQGFRPNRNVNLIPPGATHAASPTEAPCRRPTRAPFPTDRLTPP